MAAFQDLRAIIDMPKSDEINECVENNGRESSSSSEDVDSSDTSSDDFDERNATPPR